VSYTFLHGITIFSRFCSLLGLAAALSTSRPPPSPRASASLLIPTLGCATSGVLRHMAPDDEPRCAAKAVEFKQKLKVMVDAAKDMKKKAEAVRAWALAAVTLMEDKQHSAAALEEEACDAALWITDPSPPPKPETGGPSQPSDAADYKATVVTNLHIQPASVHNICSLVSIMLDPTSMHYARWCDNVLLTLLGTGWTTSSCCGPTTPSLWSC
jgi:hypothetical protein